MKVYTVAYLTEGTLDPKVYGVFSSPEKANAFIKKNQLVETTLIETNLDEGNVKGYA